MSKLKSNPNPTVGGLNPKAVASANMAASMANANAANTKILNTTAQLSTVSSVVSAMDYDTYRSAPYKHYVDLLLILPEEMLSNMLEYMECKLTGKQRVYFSCLIRDLITRRRFSEEFLLQYCEYLEDINDILVVHRYEIVNDIYKTLRFHLVGNKDVDDIL